MPNISCHLKLHFCCCNFTRVYLKAIPNETQTYNIWWMQRERITTIKITRCSRQIRKCIDNRSPFQLAATTTEFSAI